MNRAKPVKQGSLRVFPLLAQEIGFNESLLFMQIEYLISISASPKHDGFDWTYQSANSLQKEYFPFWGRTTVQRAISSLRDQGLIEIGNFNQKRYDRTMWLRIRWENAQKLKSISVEEIKSPAQNGPREIQNGPREIQNGPREIQNGPPIPSIPSSTPTTTPIEVRASETPGDAGTEKPRIEDAGLIDHARGLAEPKRAQAHSFDFLGGEIQKTEIRKTAPPPSAPLPGPVRLERMPGESHYDWSRRYWDARREA